MYSIGWIQDTLGASCTSFLYILLLYATGCTVLYRRICTPTVGAQGGEEIYKWERVQYVFQYSRWTPYGLDWTKVHVHSWRLDVQYILYVLRVLVGVGQESDVL